MGKALMIHSQTTGLPSGSECNLFGAATGTYQTTEANAQYSCTQAATFSNLGCNIISGGSGTNDLRFRKAGANGNQLASLAGTGVVEDAVNTDVLAAADLFNLAGIDTGTTPVRSWMKANVEFSSGHGNFHASAANAGAVSDVQSSTVFYGLSGALTPDGTATEANAAFRNRAYDTWAAMQVRILANARTNNSTFKNRTNIATDGTGLITVGAGLTGLFTDTGIGDALTAGQDICVALSLLTGLEDLTVLFVGGTFTSSTSKSETWCGREDTSSRNASATADYVPIGGHLAFSAYTEAQARIKPGFVATVSNLRCYLAANSYASNGTLKLYQNGVAVLTTTLTASGGAGWYENTSDTIQIDADDELSFEFDEGGASGSINVSMAGITFAPAAAGDTLFAQSIF